MKTIGTVYTLLIILLIPFVYPTTAFAAEPGTIRVGYFAFPGYHEMSQEENGPQGSGYGFDFLQLLRRYTNLNYQYVGYEDSWQEMQQMLRDGQIDMVTSARKTSQREKEFAFSSPIGTSYAELSVRSDDKRFMLNDYESFDGMTIGVLKANSRKTNLNLSDEKIPDIIDGVETIIRPQIQRKEHTFEVLSHTLLRFRLSQ